MKQENEKPTGLPENAFRPLKPGEEYHPLMSPDKEYPEVNLWSVSWGIAMAVLFSAAAAFGCAGWLADPQDGRHRELGRNCFRNERAPAAAAFTGAFGRGKLRCRTGRCSRTSHQAPPIPSPKDRRRAWR